MVECAGLEIRCTFRRTVGSNPTLSTISCPHQLIDSRELFISPLAVRTVLEPLA